MALRIDQSEHTWQKVISKRTLAKNEYHSSAKNGIFNVVRLLCFDSAMIT